MTLRPGSSAAKQLWDSVGVEDQFAWVAALSRYGEFTFYFHLCTIHSVETPMQLWHLRRGNCRQNKVHERSKTDRYVVDFFVA